MEELLETAVEVVEESTEEVVEKKEDMDSVSQKIYDMLGEFYEKGLTEDDLETILVEIQDETPSIKLVYAGGLFFDNIENHIYVFVWLDENGEIKNMNARVDNFSIAQQ